MKKVFNKKTIIVSAVNALLLILIGLCIWQCWSYSRTLRTQQAAEAWKGQSEERFAQVSYFLPVDTTVDATTIQSFRAQIDKKLVEAGAEAPPPEEGKLWTDAFSATGTVQVEGKNGSIDVTAIGVDGNFFLFHPYYLMNGSYISDSDIMKDRVVLDSNLAWNLFGSSSLEGMTITIGDKQYYVAGVIKRETDKFSEKAFSGDPLIFMSYSAFSEVTEKTTINSYELAMLDPISNYAETVVKEAFEDNKGELVQNSTRYEFSSIFKIFKDFGQRSMRTNAVEFPYWENAARLSESYIARLWVIIAVLAVIPFISLVWLCVLFIKWLVAKIKLGAKAAKEAWEDRYGRMADFKEKREQKRQLEESGEKPKKLKAKKRAKQRPEPELMPNPFEEQAEITQESYNDQEILLDVESIVREIMQEENQQ